MVSSNILAAYQRCDGLFAASKTATVAVNHDVLCKMLLDDASIWFLPSRSILPPLRKRHGLRLRTTVADRPELLDKVRVGLGHTRSALCCLAVGADLLMVGTRAGEGLASILGS